MKLEDTGLRVQPFQPHGKPLVLVPCRSQSAAIRFLNDTRSNDRGLGLFHGPRLSGKTAVIHQFTKQLPDDDAIAVVDGAGKDPDALLQDILSQFGFDHGLNTLNERFNMLRVFAMQQTASTEAPLLIIENAHAMSPIVLEVLCELAELAVRGKSALRIVFVSHQPLRQIVEAPAMQTMANRVTGKFLLQPLTQQETTNYVHTKLISGGCENPQYLAPGAVCDRLHQASGGWPGMIDRLAMTAIANAERFPLRVQHVPMRTVDKKEDQRGGAAAPHMILTHQRQTLARVNLKKPRLLIGRSELCDLRIDDEWISRQHAVLFRNEQTSIVVDLKSRNGICVNGRRVSKQVLVNDDIISVGDHRLKFVDPSARRRTTPKSAGWDDTTITQSIKNFRNALIKQLKQRKAS